MKLKLTYVCMQTLEQGQAAYAHVFEIIKGLKHREWVTELISSNASSNASMSRPLDVNKVSIIKKIAESVIAQIVYFPKIRPNVYYVRFHFLTVFILLKAKLGKIPIVYEINGPFEDLYIAWPYAKKVKSLLDFIMIYQLKNATHIVTVTPQLAVWASKFAKHERVSVIPNGANIEIFRKTIDTDYTNKYVIFFGTLASWQGIDTIINATELSEWPSDVVVMVVGDGELAERVKVNAAKNRNLVYLGRQGYDKLPDLISGALASLSIQTNVAGRAMTGLSPLKVYESLACGTPVIVSNFPGISELISEKDMGLVIPSNSPKDLINAIQTIKNETDLVKRMGLNGQEEVRRHHSWDARANATHKILLSILKEHR